MSDTSSDPELFLLKQRELELLKAKEQLISAHALSFYKPFPKQDLFHRAGRFLRRYCRSGNRFGKSHMGCAEDVSWLIGERPWYPTNDPARTAGISLGPKKGLVITTDWDKVDEIWTSPSSGKIWQYLPPDMEPKTRKNHSGAVDLITLKNKSVLRFDTVKSFKSNPMGSESSDWDFIHVDEPCPQDMWKAQSRGLVDRGGSAWFTLTPLNEMWIDDMFFNRRRGKGASVQINNLIPHEQLRWNVTGSIYDNPYLTAEAIATFEADLSSDERQCRLHGLPLELSGLVYKEFSFDRHVLTELPTGWSAFNQPPRNYTIYYAIDPHPQTPHAVLFLAVSPLGQVFVYDEIFLHCTIQALSEQILARTAGYFVVQAKVDPIAYINNPVDNTNMASVFEDCGLYLEQATKEKTNGILNLQRCLQRFNYLYFCPHLEETLWEIQRYAYDKENKPRDADDHMMENLYRLMLGNPLYIPQESSRRVETQPTLSPDNLKEVY